MSDNTGGVAAAFHGEGPALAAAKAPAADEAPAAERAPAAAVTARDVEDAALRAAAGPPMSADAGDDRLAARAVLPPSGVAREVLRVPMPAPGRMLPNAVLRVRPELPAGTTAVPGDEESFQAPGILEAVEEDSLVLRPDRLNDATLISYEIAGPVLDEVARIMTGSHVVVYFQRRGSGFVADSVSPR